MLRGFPVTAGTSNSSEAPHILKQPRLSENLPQELAQQRSPHTCLLHVKYDACLTW
jgi:hypothetical protein